MLVRVIYDPKEKWEAHSFQVNAPDFSAALEEIAFPKQLAQGDVLVQEFRKGGPYAFFQIEVPRPLLLRQKAALKTVGKARDNILIGLHLLVEHLS